MEIKKKLSEITMELMAQAQNLRDLASQASQLEVNISRMTGKLGEIDRNLEEMEKRPDVQSFNETDTVELTGMTTMSSQYSTHNSGTGVLAKIIPFPGGNPGSAESRRRNTGSDLHETPENRPVQGNFRREKFLSPVSFLAMPGELLPADIPDYRPFLQRDGLILLAWDKRITERGELYTAYWVTSAGVPRFYASRTFLQDDFFLAQPDHKSYAAEDGIEFYGQDSPAYLVHVAPELMMSNPQHGELRQAHIRMLKLQGSDVDFDYRYLLTIDKKRSPPLRKSRDQKPNQADA